MASEAAVNPALIVTHSAPTNIATIKYWGKRDSKLNLPINSSVSVTLNQDDLRATTTVVASKAFPADRLWLNNVCVCALQSIAVDCDLTRAGPSEKSL